jgi:hypothetical protein
MAESTKSSGTKRSTRPAKPARRKSTPAKKPSSATKRRSTAATAKRSSSSSRTASANGRSRSSTPSRTSSSGSSSASSNGNGFVGTVKDVAGKAKGPAVAVGAAAAGIAGGLVLRSRTTRRKTVLGVKMPRAVGKGLPDLDAKAIAKTVGHASKQFAKTSKNVSKDLERAGDQAERIGKILD